MKSTTGSLRDEALDYAARGWRLVPQYCSRNKKPYLAQWPKLASADPEVVGAWWDAWPGANVAALIPSNLVVVDFDPRHGADFEAFRRWREWPRTPTVRSGRGDGGFHAYFLRPEGELVHSLGTGIDLLHGTHLVTLPPSVHHASGQPYEWVRPVPQRPAGLPTWLHYLVLAAPPRPRPPARWAGGSPADRFNDMSSWGDVLEPHGWSLRRGDGDSDGSDWQAPGVAHDASASVRHGHLFVYDTTTPFEVTAPGQPRGYSRFKAWAVLNFAGNCSTAFKALDRGGRR